MPTNTSKLPLSKLLHDLYPLHGIHIRVDVAAFDVDAVKVLRELLSHPFGQCGDQNPLILFYPDMYLMNQVIYLVVRRSHLYDRIEQSGRRMICSTMTPSLF